MKTKGFGSLREGIMGIIHFQEMEITSDDIRMRDFLKTRLKVLRSS